MLTFTPITLEHHSLLRKYYAGCDYHLCEYSAGTKLMWSLYLRPSFAEEAGCLIVRNRIDGEWVFDYPVPGPDGDVDAALTAIESYCTDTETPLVISVVPEEKAPELLLRWPRLRMNNERNWKDYLYRAEDMAAFAGRKYSGQRNHINKFRKEYPTAKFVPLTGADMPLIENFWADYEQEFQKTSFNAKRELAYAKALARLLTAVYMLRASGAMDALAAALAPVLGLLGIPPETAALLLVRPVSGSGALAVGSQIMEQYGPDSAVGRTAAVMLGCSETTFYTVAVYFGAAGIRRTRYTIPAALTADLAAFVAAAWAVRLCFG